MMKTVKTDAVLMDNETGMKTIEEEGLKDITSESESTDNSMKSIDNYWNLEEDEFNRNYAIKMEHLEQRIEAAMEKNSTATIFKQQDELIADMTNEAVHQCEKLCDDVELKVRNKGNEYVTTLTEQLDNSEKQRTDNTLGFWTKMKTDIGDTYGKLIAINSQALKNSNILQSRILTATSASPLLKMTCYQAHPL